MTKIRIIKINSNDTLVRTYALFLSLCAFMYSLCARPPWFLLVYHMLTLFLFQNED